MQRTLRFLLLPEAGELPPPPPSLGLTVKNPSRRPCCFALMRALSLSAPLRTRSSLRAPGGASISEMPPARPPARERERGDARETLFADEKVDEAFRIRRFPLELYPHPHPPPSGQSSFSSLYLCKPRGATD